MASSTPCRLVRASVFAVVCVSLTMAGHGAASDGAVPWAAVPVGGLAVLGVAWVLAGHERSAGTILGGLLGGQFGLHVLFAAMQAGAPVHGGHGAEVSGTVAAGTGMTLAHVAAAGVSAWWLWRGERLAWALARRLAAFSLGRVLVVVGVVPGPVRAVVRPWDGRERRPREAVPRHSVGLRGPPPRPVFSTS